MQLGIKLSANTLVGRCSRSSRCSRYDSMRFSSHRRGLSEFNGHPGESLSAVLSANRVADALQS